MCERFFFHKLLSLWSLAFMYMYLTDVLPLIVMMLLSFIVHACFDVWDCDWSFAIVYLPAEIANLLEFQTRRLTKRVLDLQGSSDSITSVETHHTIFAGNYSFTSAQRVTKHIIYFRVMYWSKLNWPRSVWVGSCKRLFLHSLNAWCITYDYKIKLH